MNKKNLMPKVLSVSRQKFLLRGKAIIFVSLFIVAFSGCKVKEWIKDLIGGGDDLINEVTSTLDQAIGELSASSANWQEILQQLVNDLPEEVQSTVTNEVSNLLNRTVAATGTELRCNVDFFRVRVQQALQRIKAKFLKIDIPLPEPHLCQVVPVAVDMSLPANRRNKIEFFGYDFDMTNIKVILVNGGTETDVSRFLDIPTHYHMTLNLGATGVQLNKSSERIILRWGGLDISTMAVIQEAPKICQTSYHNFQPAPVTFKPPHTRGDKEFDGHGPSIYCSVRLFIKGGNQLVARVYMLARETKSDWTTGEGTAEYVLYTADPDKRIESLVSASYASYSYTDNDHNMDEFPGNGPVRKFKFMGDGGGNDVGYHTRVEVEFTQLRVMLKETQDCISTATLRTLQQQNFASPALVKKMSTLKSMKFISPVEADTIKQE